MENRVRARPAACFPRLEGFGIDRCKGCGWNRRRGWAQKQVKPVNCAERQERHDPPEEVREEDDLLTGKELKLFQSVAVRFNFLAVDRPDLLYSVKELMRKMASPRTQDFTQTSMDPIAQPY